MSRCFPYPPPGFKPKLTTDHADLLHKEKQKDKKHKKDKKDKKDKDKRESKDKREKESKDKREKESKDKQEKDKHGTQSVLPQVPMEKKSEDSRILAEHSRRIDEGPQAGRGGQVVERRFTGTSTNGASEKRPIPVPVQKSVPSVHRKSNDAMKVGPTNQSANHRVTVANERRNPGMPSTSAPEEGMIAQKTFSSALNPNVMNSNSLAQRKNNDPPKHVANNHGPNFTERRIVGTEAKKPVPSPFNSRQENCNGISSQSLNHQHLPVTNSMPNRVTASERCDEAKRVAGNSVVQMQKKTDGPAFQVTNNHDAAGLRKRRVGSNQSIGPTPEKEKDSEKGGLNLRESKSDSIKQEERKKEKRRDRDERKKEKEQRRLEKKQRKEREKQDREKKKENERDKFKEVGDSMMKPFNEGFQRKIEKVGATDGVPSSKKRKEGERNGFLHEDDLRAPKLVRTSSPDTLKKNDVSSNGSLHENDVGSTKFTIRLPPYPPPLENGRTSNHSLPPYPPPPENGRTSNHPLPPYPPPPENGRTSNHPPRLLSPPIKLSSSSPGSTTTNNTSANINTIKADVLSSKKAPQLNGTVPDATLSKKRKEKPPHPDLKYLNVVYFVPKLEEKELMPQSDDQEWLFGTKPNGNPNPNSKMLGYGLSQGSGQVWDRAVLLDSANAFALPYVVPF